MGTEGPIAARAEFRRSCRITGTRPAQCQSVDPEFSWLLAGRIRGHTGTPPAAACPSEGDCKFHSRKGPRSTPISFRGPFFLTTYSGVPRMAVWLRGRGSTPALRTPLCRGATAPGGEYRGPCILGGFLRAGRITPRRWSVPNPPAAVQCRCSATSADICVHWGIRCRPAILTWRVGDNQDLGSFGQRCDDWNGGGLDAGEFQAVTLTLIPIWLVGFVVFEES